MVNIAIVGATGVVGTKMIERIKSLGEMETKQKCVVQRFEIIIPLHQK